MEKWELEQYKYFEPNIRALKFMIQKTENEAKIAGYPSNRTIERAKKDIAAYKKEIAEYRQRQLDVVNFINDIQDEDTRKLIVYRFVKGKGWRETARRAYYSEGAARAKVNYYLKTKGIV